MVKGHEGGAKVVQISRLVTDLDCKGGNIQDMQAGGNTQQPNQMPVQQGHQQLLQSRVHGGQGLSIDVQPGRVDCTQQPKAFCTQLLSLLACIACDLCSATVF